MTDIDITFVEVEPDVILVAQLPEIPGGGGGGGVVSVNGDFGPNVVLGAEDITTGVFGIGRIPTGTTGSTVALGNHLHTGVYDPAGSAAAAQAAAISAAATDATTKANNAQSAAVATAAADATTKANAAQANAIAAAATDATTKANAAVVTANAYTDAQNANDVHLTGNQTVAGIKTFSSIPVLPGTDPSANNEATRKLYVDTGVSGAISTAAADATTKANAAVVSANGYTDSQLALAVLLTGAQSISGVKTFNSSPIGPDPTTAQQLATKAYVDANAGGTDFWVDYWRGVYNAGTTYTLNQIVRSINAKGMYRCKVASSLGVAPPAFVPGVNQSFFAPTVPGSHDADATPITIGMRFTPLVDGQINGLRFYKGVNNTGTHVARLWADSGSVLIGGPTNFVGETASGWQYQAFPAPISVTAGTVYVCGVDCTNGNYEFQPQFFAAGSVTRGQLTGLAGVFTTTVGTKPTNTFNNNFYSGEPDFTTATPSPDNWEIMVLAP